MVKREYLTFAMYLKDSITECKVEGMNSHKNKPGENFYETWG